MVAARVHELATAIARVIFVSTRRARFARVSVSSHMRIRTLVANRNKPLTAVTPAASMDALQKVHNAIKSALGKFTLVGRATF